MNPWLKRIVLAGVIGAVLVIVVAAGMILATSNRAPAANSTPAPSSVSAESSSPAASPAAAGKPAAAPLAKPDAKPTVAGQAKPDAKPTTATQVKPEAKPAAKPDTPADVDRPRIAREATWTPGQLRSHFEKHGEEGPWASESVYDASAREVVTAGVFFTYVDRESNAERLGFYDKPGNRFTSVTRDGRRITTHFRPDRGESYVRGLNRSTYR